MEKKKSLTIYYYFTCLFSLYIYYIKGVRDKVYKFILEISGIMLKIHICDSYSTYHNNTVLVDFYRAFLVF